jgi:hypothetical protein
MAEALKQINDFVEEIDSYVGRPMARSQEDAAYLLDNPAEHLLRKFHATRTFPEDIKAKIPQVCEAWEKTEAHLLRSLKISREELIGFFEDALENRNGDWTLPENQSNKCWDLRLYGLVRNIGWPEAFTCSIPAGAPEWGGQARTAGQMMAAIFALEKMGRHTEYPSSDMDQTMKRLKAYYSFAEGTQKGGAA